MSCGGRFTLALMNVLNNGHDANGQLCRLMT